MFVKSTFLKYIRAVMPCQTGEEGFTLIEIIVAVVIMGLAYVAILQSFSLSTRNIAKVEEVRANMLQYALQFDQEYLESRVSDNDAFGEEGDEDIFLEGSRYKLLHVSDETNTFLTLRLETL